MAFDANDLSPHESYVVDRTREGEIADFTPMIGGDGVKPAVRAGFLRRLLLELDPSWAVRSPGVRLKGVRIEGALDLTDCSGAGGAGLSALSLENCDIPETVDLSHSRLARVSFKGSRMRRLIATEAAIDGELHLGGVTPLANAGGGETLTVHCRGLRVDGDLWARGAKFAQAADDPNALFLQAADIAGSVFFDDGFEAFGCVSLAGAKIGGRLQFDAGRVLNRTDAGDGIAIRATDLRVDGAICLRQGFLAEGEARFSGARIGGDFDISGAVCRNEGAAALTLTNAEIGGQFIGAAKIAGQVHLQSTAIGRNLDLRGAEIGSAHKKNGAAHASEYATAIDAANLRVGGAALLQGANIKGEVFLADARIEGYLALGGGRFINGGGWAIRAPNIRVGGNLTLKIDETGFAPHGQKTVIEGGAAEFDRAHVEGAVAWLNLELRGPGPEAPEAKGPIFSLADVVIGGPLQARGLVAQQEARIDLSGASCNALDDDLKTGWGMDRASLDLDGFSYARVEARSERWRHRLTWLKRGQRHGPFSPQPYTQLAEVYARAGRREDARRILLAQHDQRAMAASAGPLTWALSSLFGLIAGYGFAPIRAARALILFLALGITAVVVMNAQGALVRPDGRACNGAVEPALYAIDVALPVIDLGQEQRCAPGRAPRAVLPAGIELPDTDWRLFEGVALWRWGQSLYAILGAILSALAIVTFSGVLKPKDD